MLITRWPIAFPDEWISTIDVPRRLGSHCQLWKWPLKAVDMNHVSTYTQRQHFVWLNTILFFFFFGSYIVKQFVESDSSLALIQWTESYSLLILLWLFLFPFGFFRLSYIQSNTREARWGWRWFMSYCSCQHWHSLTPLVHFTSAIKAEFPKRHSCSENYATLLNSCHWQKKKMTFGNFQ